MAEQKTKSLWTSLDQKKLGQASQSVKPGQTHFIQGSPSSHRMWIKKKADGGQEAEAFIIHKNKEGGSILPGKQIQVQRGEDQRRNPYVAKIIKMPDDYFALRELEFWKLLYGEKIPVRKFSCKKLTSKGEVYKHYVLMPRVAKHDLMSFKNLSTPVFLRIIASLAKILMRLHGYGYIHRDIKRENVLFSPAQGKVYLIDFSGVVREDFETGLWGTTPEFVAPEIDFKPKDSPDVTRIFKKSADIFPLGILILELLTNDRRDPKQENYAQYIDRCLASKEIDRLFPEKVRPLFIESVKKMIVDNPDLRPPIKEIFQFFRWVELKYHLPKVVDALQQKVTLAIDCCIQILGSQRAESGGSNPLLDLLGQLEKQDQVGGNITLYGFRQQLEQQFDPNAEMGSPEFEAIANAVENLEKLHERVQAKVDEMTQDGMNPQPGKEVAENLQTWVKHVSENFGKSPASATPTWNPAFFDSAGLAVKKVKKIMDSSIQDDSDIRFLQEDDDPESEKLFVSS